MLFHHTAETFDVQGFTGDFLCFLNSHMLVYR